LFGIIWRIEGATDEEGLLKAHGGRRGEGDEGPVVEACALGAVPSREAVPLVRIAGICGDLLG
jgi:hypothetical protein